MKHFPPYLQKGITLNFDAYEDKPLNPSDTRYKITLAVRRTEIVREKNIRAYIYRAGGGGGGGGGGAEGPLRPSTFHPSPNPLSNCTRPSLPTLFIETH